MLIGDCGRATGFRRTTPLVAATALATREGELKVSFLAAALVLVSEGTEAEAEREFVATAEAREERWGGVVFLFGCLGGGVLAEARGLAGGVELIAAAIFFLLVRLFPEDDDML
jgi:hypothetical protein